MIITLDGPCGSGKSTVAQLLAQRLGFFYINSGYLYRSLAYLLVKEYGYDAEKMQSPNIDHVALLLHEDNFVYHYEHGTAHIFFKSVEITHYLKDSIISHYASIISAHAQVRQQIVPLQQKFANQHHVVTDGRDGGTEIYPQAQFKFYVTAAPEVRAQRLHIDFHKKGMQISVSDVHAMIIERDERDMTRAISPLKKADDAIEIDTSHATIDEIVDRLYVTVTQ